MEQFWRFSFGNSVCTEIFIRRKVGRESASRTLVQCYNNNNIENKTKTFELYCNLRRQLQSMCNLGADLREYRPGSTI